MSESKLKYLSPISGTKIQLVSPYVRSPFRTPIRTPIGLYFKLAENTHIVNRLLINKR
jgi:hypothetical protein